MVKCRECPSYLLALMGQAMVEPSLEADAGGLGHRARNSASQSNTPGSVPQNGVVS
jgi:hypothetical protein